MRIEKIVCPNCQAPLTGDFVPNQKIECSHCHTPLIVTHLDQNQPIVCPQCRTLNDEEIRFCNNCGTQISIDCVLCHTSNRVDMRHCVKCGVHLTQARLKRDSMRQKANLLREERLEALKAKELRQREEKLERLLDALDEPENHDMAIYQLQQMGVFAVETLLETLLEDEDVDARYGSARALGQIMASSKLNALDKNRVATVKALIQALADSDLAVRYWAVQALGMCSSNLAITPLSELLDDPHPGVRDQARHSLQKIGGDRVEKILAEHKPKKGFFAWLAG